MTKVNEFLAKKSIHYDKIDRFVAFRMFEKYKDKIALKPIIHIVGTNGKGSTGRFLAQLLENLSFKVGHYTSPHILSFNERFYLKGEIASDELLDFAHDELKSIFKEDLEKISYFEYATFLAAVLFKDCDFIIFEAGLGGEYDATSVFEKKLSIFTRIGYDHIQILGSSLKEIARTKLKVMAKMAIISNEQEELVLKLAKKIALLKGADLKFSKAFEDENLNKEFENYALNFALPQFLKHNLMLALNACLFLTSKEQSLKALKELKNLNLAGRCQKISENLFIDVGHNEMAALALKEYFKEKKITLVYNSYLDKEIFKILQILKPIIDTIQIYRYSNEDRKPANDLIFGIAKELNIQCGVFKRINPKEITLVFGSFILVENFLKEYCDKR